MTKTSASTEPARVLADRYELIERIGAGGMAEVWRGRDRRLSRDVAVKLLAGPALRDPSRRRRIEREARTLATFSDPRIVAVYDYGEEPTADGDVLPYLVMELVDGPDLHRYLLEHGRLDSASALGILRTVASAVARAHEEGIIHGDLKPANIFVDKNGPKVGDFGVARVLDEETGSTTLAATPAFAAPEVLRGGKPTSASDVYSLACLAFEMLTGHTPYEGSNAWEVASKHLEAPIPSVRVSRPEVSVGLDEAIRRGMDKDPRQRPPTAGAFAESLGELPETVPLAAGEPAVATPDATEALPSRPDLKGAVFFGPFAGLVQRARESLGKRPVGPRTSRRRRIIAAIVIGLAIPLFLLLAGGRGDNLRVPDVHGQTEAAAAATLQRAGIALSGVSYEPVTQGSAGIVLRTIPGAGQSVARGSPVHVIASAFAAPTATPAPAAVPVTPRSPRKAHGKDGGGD